MNFWGIVRQGAGRGGGGGGGEKGAGRGLGEQRALGEREGGKEQEGEHRAQRGWDRASSCRLRLLPLLDVQVQVRRTSWSLQVSLIPSFSSPTFPPPLFRHPHPFSSAPPPPPPPLTATVPVHGSSGIKMREAERGRGEELGSDVPSVPVPPLPTATVLSPRLCSSSFTCFSTTVGMRGKIVSK